jgi:hypothetical protein
MHGKVPTRLYVQIEQCIYSVSEDIHRAYTHIRVAAAARLSAVKLCYAAGAQFASLPAVYADNRR